MFKLQFMVTADSDVGLRKTTNQDSVLVKHAMTSVGEIVLAVLCDGMGGLEKGELASATVIRRFAQWFDYELPNEISTLNMDVIASKWDLMLKEINVRIQEYGNTHNVSLGTTCSGILFIENHYLIAHIGDTRVYYIGESLQILTTDHTVVGREVGMGLLTHEQAKKDPRRNVLLQCIGASQSIVPQIVQGETARGIYMLCSDGFFHEITENEIISAYRIEDQLDKATMHEKSKHLIELVKTRHEKDNISVILIKVM